MKRVRVRDRQSGAEHLLNDLFVRIDAMFLRGMGIQYSHAGRNHFRRDLYLSGSATFALAVCHDSPVLLK